MPINRDCIHINAIYARMYPEDSATASQAGNHSWRTCTMTLKLSRRDLMIGASSAVAATALGGLINNGAVASEELPGHAQDELKHNQAFAPIDRVLRHAADSKTVAGVVALGATEKGVVYEGAFGKADLNA